MNGDQVACERMACAGVDCATPPFVGSVVCGGTDPSPTTDRWTPAVQGLKRVAAQFQAELSFGLTLFPGEAAGMSTSSNPGADLCAAGTVRVPSSASDPQAIAKALDAARPGGATPLASTLTAVLEQLRARPAAALPRSLLLLTDGQPTCPNAGGNTLNGSALAADQALAVQAVDALRTAGIKTFVLGFVTPTETALAAALGELAMHGGTGTFHRVQDAQSIVDAFAQIEPALDTSCSLRLEGERDARLLSVELDGARLAPQAADGWVLEGATLTLQGAACDGLSKAGAPPTVQEWCEPLEP